MADVPIKLLISTAIFSSLHLALFKAKCSVDYANEILFVKILER